MMRCSLLSSLVALVLWSLVVCASLYATHIPAMIRRKIVDDPNRPPEVFQAKLPVRMRWTADDHNDLIEQSTVFYAVEIVLILFGADGALNSQLAWLYVALRVVYSLVHALVNIRFGIFITSTLVLLALALHAPQIVIRHRPRRPTGRPLFCHVFCALIPPHFGKYVRE